MSRSQKFFRGLWRVNAVLILIATGAIAVGAGALIVEESRRNLNANQVAKNSPVADTNGEEQLVLGQASVVAGTDIIRLDLTTQFESTKFGSGGQGRETRNILFIEPGQKTARWLLPDNQHHVSEPTDVFEKPESDSAKTVATATLIRKVGDASEGGRLILFDPAGKKVTEVSKNATQVHLATLAGSDIVLLYQNGSRLERATFDRESLAKKSEQEVEIPKLK